MASTANCSRGKSREQNISEAILQRFDHLKVSGMPWQVKGEGAILPVKAMVANFLCERHNGALSPLDRLGANAFDAFVAALDYAVTQRHPGRIQHHLISGKALELWMIKLMAGVHFGGIAAAEMGILLDELGFPIEEAVTALSAGTVPRRGGMFVQQNPGLLQQGQIGVGPLIDVASERTVGVHVQFGPLRFETVVIELPIGVREAATLAARRRPWVIDFVGPARDARIVMSWAGRTDAVNRVAIEIEPHR